jgi:hypothetical protein
MTFGLGKDRRLVESGSVGYPITVTTVVGALLLSTTLVPTYLRLVD